jgi:hypothetical protein
MVVSVAYLRGVSQATLQRGMSSIIPTGVETSQLCLIKVVKLQTDRFLQVLTPHVFRSAHKGLVAAIRIST